MTTLPEIPKQPVTGVPIILFPAQMHWFLQAFEAVRDSLVIINTKLENTMATVTDLESKLDAIDSALTGEDGVFENLAADLAGLKTEIQALKDQVAAGSPVSQGQLDDLVGRADSIATKAAGNAQKLADLAASTPDAEPA